MSKLDKAVKQAIVAAIPGAVVTPDAAPQAAPAPAPSPIPVHVAANICKFLERVKNVEGLESIAWVEAYGLMQIIGAPILNQGKQGVPFQGLGK